MAKIIQAAQPIYYTYTQIPTGAVHNYWVKISDNGSVSQMHGWSRDAMGNIDITGVGTHLWASSQFGYNFSSSTTQSLAYVGSDKAANALWSAASYAANLINSHDYTYNLLATLGGKNSNSVFNSLAKAMGLPVADLGWAPGINDVLISDAEIARAIELAYHEVFGDTGAGGGGGGGETSPGGGGGGGGGPNPGQDPKNPDVIPIPMAHSPAPIENSMSAFDTDVTLVGLNTVASDGMLLI